MGDLDIDFIYLGQLLRKKTASSRSGKNIIEMLALHSDKCLSENSQEIVTLLNRLIKVSACLD